MDTKIKLSGKMKSSIDQIKKVLPPGVISADIDSRVLDLRKIVPARRGTLKAAVGKSDQSSVADATKAIKETLSGIFDHAAPVLGGDLDNAMSVFGKKGAMRAGLEKFLVSCGGSKEEVKWLLDECDQVDFKLVEVIASGDVKNLKAVLKSISGGGDLMHSAGFPLHTGDSSTDARVSEAIGRCRARGISLSLFHLLIIAVGMAVMLNIGESGAKESAFHAAFS